MIPKPGKSHLKPENFRPISLLTSISKVLEKIILQPLKKLIKPRPEQHAFREGHSTTTQLYTLFKEIQDNNINRKYTAAIFIDMEKAFDRVWHEGLIYKLRTQTDLPTNIIKLIKSFLLNRSFQIRVTNSLSTPRHIEAGVPQGSCLSPILYSLYINDLPTIDRVKTLIFADDTMFHTNHRNKKYATYQLQKQIDLTLNWMNKWRLSLNIGKTETIIFGAVPGPNTPKIKIQGQTIKWKNKIKYLGITIDAQLKMNQHVQTAIQKARGARIALYPVINAKSRIPLKTRLQLYLIYIRPILLYGSVVWASLVSQTNREKIEAVQNISLRIITGSHYLTRNEAIRNSANILSVSEYIKNAKSIFLHRASISKHSHIQSLTH